MLRPLKRNQTLLGLAAAVPSLLDPRSNHLGRSGTTEPWRQWLGEVMSCLADTRRAHRAVLVSLGQQKALCFSAVISELK